MKKNKKNIKKEVKNILNFYKTLGIQISLDRFIRSLPKDVKKKEAVKVAESLGYEFRSNETERVKTLNKKWSVLTDYIYLFDFIPFVEFVIVSGSLA
ncbi:MAG: hypothetical protein ABEI53_00810, partial [Candidatus Magasanikbacteria bacterium]